jgi:uncharacterized membrane protein
MGSLGRYAAGAAGGFMAVIVFFIVGPGIAAVLMGLGVNPTLAGIIGVSIWYGLRYLARQHLQKKAIETVDAGKGAASGRE